MMTCAVSAPEVQRLGRTLRAWQDQLAYSKCSILSRQ